jgi:hypothetical protein
MNRPKHLDDAVPSEAPADALGLLGDLAAEARAERAVLEAARGERADAAADARRREEAIRREALQAELIEETRRRNASRLLTAPEVETASPVAKAVTASVPEPVAAPAPRSRWLMAAGVLLLVGGGGAAVALSQAPADGIEVDGLASRANQVGETVVAATMTAREAAADAAPVAAELPGEVAPAGAEVGEAAVAEPEAAPEVGGTASPNSEAATVKKPISHRPSTKTPPVKRPAITTDFDKIYGGGKKK